MESLLSSASVETTNSLSGTAQTVTSPSLGLDRVHLEDRLAELKLLQQAEGSSGAAIGGPTPAYRFADSADNRLLQLSRSRTSSEGGLSPIWEGPSVVYAQTPPLGVGSSGTNTRSVSAAVSDESVAGDSGVFEASNRKSEELLNNETTQIQIKLR